MKTKEAMKKEGVEQIEFSGYSQAIKDADYGSTKRFYGFSKEIPVDSNGGNKLSPLMVKKRYDSNLQYLIERNVISKKVSTPVIKKEVLTDSNNKLDELLIDYIMEKFAMKEVHLIFYACAGMYGLEQQDVIAWAKQQAIESINDEDTISTQEKKRLKGIVWNMNHILFGLILELIKKYNFFFDPETDVFYFPR